MVGRLAPASFELDPRLLAGRLVGGAGTVLRLRQRRRRRTERFERPEVPVLELFPVATPQVRHETQVVVLAAPVEAVHLPAADVAVRNRFGVSRSGFSVLNRGFQSAAGEPVVRREVGDPEGFLDEGSPRIGPRRNDDHVLRRNALDPVEQVGVETELQDRPGLRFAGEFRVHGFVRPIPETAAARNPAQDVRASEPPAVPQRSLNDEPGPPPHRVFHGIRAAGLRQPLHRAPVVRQMVEVGVLVLEPALPQNFDFVRPPRRLRRRPPPTERDLEVQPRQMPTRQVVSEVTRGEPDLAGFEPFHRLRCARQSGGSTWATLRQPSSKVKVFARPAGSWMRRMQTSSPSARSTT